MFVHFEERESSLVFRETATMQLTKIFLWTSDQLIQNQSIVGSNVGKLSLRNVYSVNLVKFAQGLKN